MDTLGNFFHLRAFANNKLLRMFALCMVLAVFGALAPCANADDFRFTVTADNRPSSELPGAFQQVLSQIGNVGEFHISAGDIDPVDQTYQYLKDKFGNDVKWYPVVGNHELPGEGGEAYYGANLKWLRDYYDEHLEGMVNQGPTDGEKTTYSWDYGNAHFIVLNEYYGCDEDEVCYDNGNYLGSGEERGDVTNALFNWLSADLAATNKPAIFVFGHEPAFPQNNHLTDSLNYYYYLENRDRFWNLLENDLLEKRNVTAYICGHTHWYSRYQKPGGQVWQIDVGAAGVDYGTDGYLTFLDVTVSDNQVIFRVYRGTDPTDLSLYESWTNTDDFIIKNLLYTPVSPCRIVDSRNTSAGIIGTTPRDFHVFGDADRISEQGGNPAGCPSPLGKPLAAHINMIAVNPNGKGNLKAFPVTTRPQRGLSVNYNTIDTNLANAGTVKIRYGSGSDITVTSRFSSAHTVIDVLGYYYPDEGFFYTPVDPCRIVDTRKGWDREPIRPFEQRDFYVSGPDTIILPQGGDPDGCPSPLGVPPEAAHVNMIAVDPTGKGNLQTFPVGSGPGAGLSVNYNTIDTNLANAGTVKSNASGATKDITVTSRFSSAHTVIDVLGYYYSAPEH